MSIKNFLIQQFFSHISSKEKLITKYSNAFYNTILPIVKCEELAQHLRTIYEDYIKRFQIQQYKEDQRNTIASNLTWTTINSYCLNITNSYNINKAKNIIILGKPGVGKTALICSICENILSKEPESKIKLMTHNLESYLLVKKQIAKLYSDMSILPHGVQETPNYVIHEIVSPKEVNNIRNNTKGIKLFIVFDSQQSVSSISSFNEELQQVKGSISGIIITKGDHIGSIACLLVAPFVTQLKIIAICSHEISSKNRKIDGTYKLTEIVINKVFNKSKDAQEANKTINNIVDTYNIDDYSAHLKTLIELDNNQMTKVAEMVLDMQSTGKINIPDEQLSVIKELKSHGINDHDKEWLRKITHIVNSLRKCEKRDVDSITDERIKKIAYGSGCKVSEVYDAFKSYKQHREIYAQQLGKTT